MLLEVTRRCYPKIVIALHVEFVITFAALKDFRLGSLFPTPSDVAIGCAGIAAVVDLRGTEDAFGRELMVTEVCVADELAAAADLVCGKASGVPVALVRGVDPTWLRDGSIREEVVRNPAEDLFR